MTARTALLATVLVLSLALTGCDGSGGKILTVDRAKDATGSVSVKGFLVAPEGKPVRLCSGVLESYPPQCGEPSIVVEELDLATVDGLTKTNDPSLAQVTWSERDITVSGTLDGDVLTVD